MREIHNMIDFEVPGVDLRVVLEVLGVSSEAVDRAASLLDCWSGDATMKLITSRDDDAFGFTTDGLSIAISTHTSGRATIKLTWISFGLTSADHVTRRVSRAFPSTLVWMTQESYEDLLTTITSVRDDQVEYSIWHELGAGPSPDENPTTPPDVVAAIEELCAAL